MIRLFQIAVFSFLIFHLAGCNAPEESDTSWQNLKIGDLAPSHSGKRPGSHTLKTMNFNVYILEMPAEKVTALDDIWPMLHTGVLRFNDYNAFGSNSFSVGFGQRLMWNRVVDLLLGAGAKKAQTISLLLPPSRANDVNVTRLYGQQTVFYASTEGSMEGADIGPGKLVLRIKAEKIPGFRGVCGVNVLPVFTSPMRGLIPRSADGGKPGEFVFGSAGFGLRMGPGDFILLGPQEYSSNQITLGSLFFSKPKGSLFFNEAERKPPERKPAVRLFLLVCTGIND